MHYPSKILEQAVEEISQLPGIGKRTALRLALHMLQRSESQTEALAKSLIKLVNEIKYCKKCFALCDSDLCEICSDSLRDESIICVVEDIRDVMAIENTGQYKGVYHVLGGKISPMEGIGPEKLNIAPLIERVEKANEIIFAMSSTMEGDTTVFYLYKILKDKNIKLSTIARGIGIGDELEYADELTLGRSITHRVPYEEVL
ncbi:recombination mediator RecR [Weeksellaceae bacterium TAE3-ERU29]|nr:recombination mediator RecR [Weeksellaceae bacterium TAE3-ERU29]